jgi:hypothetical protein
LSLLEKSIAVNVLASSKIWYIGSGANFHFFKAQVPSSLKRKCPFKKAQMSYQKAQMSFADLNIKTLTGRITIPFSASFTCKNVSDLFVTTG